MQLDASIFTNFVSGFQSSPVPEDGCNGNRLRFEVLQFGFNPHPSRRTGATV